MASAEPMPVDTTKATDNGFVDRGYDAYRESFLDMRVRIFRGHVESMPYNADKVSPSFVGAIMDVKRELESMPGMDEDTLVKDVLKPPISLVVIPDTQQQCNTGDEPSSDTKVVFGSGKRNINLSAHVLVQPRVKIYGGMEYEPDPSWVPPPETVEFAVKAALSMRDRDSTDADRVHQIDLNRLKDPLVRARAQRIFGAQVRYLVLTDPVPVSTDVYYDLHTGTVKGFALFVATPYLSKESLQTSPRMTIEDLWDVIKHKDTEKSEDRLLPEHNLFKTLVKERFQSLQTAADYRVRLDALQSHLEKVRKDAYATFQKRRENKMRPGEKFSGWEHLKSECLRHLNEPDPWDISLFLWRYYVYFADEPNPPAKAHTAEARVQVNGFLAKLAKWLCIHLDWLFSMPLLTFNAVLSKELKNDETATSGKKRVRDDDDTDSSDSEDDKPWSNDNDPTIVNVLFGPRNAGKSLHCETFRSYETFSLFEYMKFVSVFPYKAVYLTLSCTNTKTAQSLLDSQQFVEGTFLARLNVKAGIKEAVAPLEPYSCTLERTQH